MCEYAGDFVFDIETIACGTDELSGLLDWATDEVKADFTTNAALSPVTSRVAMIAYRYIQAGQTVTVDLSEVDERVMIEQLWDRCTAAYLAGRKVITVNGHDFDLPYCCQRSWIIGVDVPPWVLRHNGVGNCWPECFVDLRRVWLCGRHGGRGITSKSSFKWLSKAFKTGGNPPGVDGSMFGEMYSADITAARAYARGDVEQPARWAVSMGVCGKTA